MKRADVDTFEKLNAQLDSVHQEIAVLVKKSPNDAVNQFKMKFINSALDQCNTILGTKYRPFQDFENFSSDELPTNSDVSFIISQYIECMEKFRADNIEFTNFEWHWKTKDGTKINTKAPNKFDKR
jgi:hypothetical protein